MEVLYQDSDFIFVVKPIGVESEKEMITLLKQDFEGEFFPVHRLDLNVGGLMVYARNKRSAATISKIIQDNKMEKEYVALIHGKIEKEAVLEDLLFKDARKNKVFVVKRMRKGVKNAKLSYVRLNDSDPSLVRVHLYTGRSHQIRVQFASRGYPLLGDHKYGAKDAHKQIYLFSCKIAFTINQKKYEFEVLPQWAKEVE